MVSTMVSRLHELLIEMFREKPSLAAMLLDGTSRVDVPEFSKAHLSSGELNDVAPTEYRADAVITLEGSGGPVLAIVIEVQLKPDKDKRRTWPAYVGTLYARVGCPIVLLVICPTQKVANWCATPIDFGRPGLTLTPVVLGPEQVPVVTDLETARRAPELTILSAIAHGSRPDPIPIFEAFRTALDVLDEDHSDLYTDLVLLVLSAAARECLEKFMTVTDHRFKSSFARRNFSRGKAEGKAEGEAQAVLAVLDVRGIEVPEAVRDQIAACSDLDQLGAWIRRAAVANKIEDVDEQFGTDR